jgi:hypothetical protein
MPNYLLMDKQLPSHPSTNKTSLGVPIKLALDPVNKPSFLFATHQTTIFPG